MCRATRGGLRPKSEGSVASGVLIQKESEASSYRLSHTGRPEAESSVAGGI